MPDYSINGNIEGHVEPLESSQARILVVAHPSNRKPVLDAIPKGYAVDIASNVVDGAAMAASGDYFAVIADEVNIADKAGDAGIKIANHSPEMRKRLSITRLRLRADIGAPDFRERLRESIAERYGALETTVADNYEPAAQEQETYRVLVVDDDKSSRVFYKAALTKSGFEVTLEDTVAGAQEKIDELNPHVVLTDWNMPDGGGNAVADYVAKHHPETPVIVVTGSGNQTDLGTIGSYSKVIYAARNKPIDLYQLARLVTEAASKKKEAPEKPEIDFKSKEVLQGGFMSTFDASQEALGTGKPQAQGETPFASGYVGKKLRELAQPSSETEEETGVTEEDPKLAAIMAQLDASAERAREGQQ